MKKLLVFLSLCLVVSCEKTTPPATETAAPAPDAPQPATPLAWLGRTSANSGLPCAVEGVLSQSCRRCHWDPQENDAPFPLRTWEDTRAVRSGKEIHVLMMQMVDADLMPPLDALVEPKVEPLTAQQKTVLLDWLRQGAQKSSEKCSL